MKTVLCALVFTLACGGKKPAPAAPPADKPTTEAPATGSGSGTECPATLNCQPPTDDKDTLCKLPPAELKQRCPNTQILE